MFSSEMTQAVNTAQACINACNNAENILLVAVDDINKFCTYLNELDPSGIKFDKKGIFNNMRVKAYWEKLSEYYPAVETLLDKLQADKNIIDNTIGTLTRITNDYNCIFEGFENAVNQDNEYMQQLIVAKNMKSLLENTMTEYDTLGKKLNLIINVSKQVFDMAISIADSVYKITIRNTGSSLSSSADVYMFKNRFADLRNVVT